MNPGSIMQFFSADAPCKLLPNSLDLEDALYFIMYDILS